MWHPHSHTGLALLCAMELLWSCHGSALRHGALRAGLVASSTSPASICTGAKRVRGQRSGPARWWSQASWPSHKRSPHTGAKSWWGGLGVRRRWAMGVATLPPSRLLVSRVKLGQLRWTAEECEVADLSGRVVV
ncbi:hypothetical protein V8C86DRAFT_3134590 [Haematococcus lacustris]